MRFERLHSIVLLICFLTIHAGLWYVYGKRMLFDSTIYISSADALLTGTFVQNHHLFYVVPIGCLALFRSVFPDEVLPFLIFQIALSGAAIVALYHAASATFNARSAGFFAALIYALWWDNMQWNTTVMTESIFSSTVCFVLLSVARFKGRRRDWGLLIFLILLLCFTRPTGIIVLLGSVGFLMRYYWHALSLRPVVRNFILTIVSLVVVVAAFVMFSIWDFTEQLEKGNLITYADVVEDTTLAKGTLRMDTANIYFVSAGKHPLLKMLGFVMYNPWYFVKSSVVKIWYLLSATRPYYSWKHNLFSLLWLSFLYLMFYRGARMLADRAVLMMIVAVVIANCILIGIGTVDWDNRFYIPMMPGIAMLAGGGIVTLFFRRTMVIQSNGENFDAT